MSEPVPDPEFVRAVAREVAKLMREPSLLLTAREVAMQLGVRPEWVYEHADDLGVIRIGKGSKPRLRFHRTVVERRLAPPSPHWEPQPSQGQTNGARRLLPIKPPPRHNHREE